MRVVQFFLISFFFLQFPSAVQGQIPKPQQAEIYMKYGDFLAAIALYNDLLAEDPDNELYLLNRGWCKLNASSFTEGTEDLLAALQLNQRCSRCYIGLAMFSLQNGFLNDALEQADLAVKSEDTASFNYFIRAQIHESKGDDLKAARDFNRAIELNPYMPDYHYGRGMYLFRIGKYEAAVNDFSTAVILAPKVAEFHFQLGYTHYMLRNLDYAMMDVRKAIELKPDRADYWLGKGAIEEAAGKNDSAIRSYSETIRLNPDNALAYYNRANLYFDAGKLDESCTDYRSCVNALKIADFPREDMRKEAQAMLDNHCDTNSPAYFYQRGFVAMELGRTEDALEAYEAGIRRWPTHPLLQGFRGSALLSQNRYREAVDAYHMALSETAQTPKDVLESYTLKSQEVNPELYMRQLYSSIYDGMAKAYLSLGLYDSAMNAVKRAIFLAEKIPDAPVTSLKLFEATVLEASGRDPQALEIVNALINDYPDLAAAYVVRARLLMKKAILTGNKRARFRYATDTSSGMFYLLKPTRFKAGKTDPVMVQSAIADCRTALVLNPDFAEAWFIIGQIKLYSGMQDYCNDFLQAEKSGIPGAIRLLELPCSP